MPQAVLMPEPLEEVEQPFRLHQIQADFHFSTATYRAYVGGRGAGKSVAGAFDLLMRAEKDRTYLIGSPTGVMMNDTTYPATKKIATELGLWDEDSVRKTPYPTAVLTTGATIRFRSFEDPEKARGPNLSGTWLDEASLMPRAAYDIAIAALREDGRQGWLSATFTPKGPSHWTHEVFNTGKPDTAIFKARTGDNPFNPVGFEQTLQQQYGETQFARQELGGEFVSIAGAEFPAEWFNWPNDGIWFSDWPDNPTFKVMYLDPSKGVSDFQGNAKKQEHGDYQCWIMAALVREKTPENHSRWAIYLDANMVNNDDVINMIGRGINLARDFRPQAIYFEDNGTMGFMEPEVRRQALASDILIPWFPVTHTTPKIQRIRVLGGYLCQHQIRLRATPGGKLLRAQLGDVPFGDHDDGPDAAAGAIEALAAMLNPE